MGYTREVEPKRRTKKTPMDINNEQKEKKEIHNEQKENGDK